MAPNASGAAMPARRRNAMIADKLAQVHARIASACEAAGRPVESVTLLAVSKTFGADAVAAAHAAGQRRFGENYVQEALAKIATLADLRAAPRMAPDRTAAEQQDARRRRAASTGCIRSTG